MCDTVNLCAAKSAHPKRAIYRYMIGYNIISPLAPENNQDRPTTRKCGKRQAMCYDKAGTSSMLAIEHRCETEGERAAAPTRWGPQPHVVQRAAHTGAESTWPGPNVKQPRG